MAETRRAGNERAESAASLPLLVVQTRAEATTS